MNHEDLNAMKQAEWASLQAEWAYIQCELHSPVQEDVRASLVDDDSVITVESDDDISDDDSTIKTHSSNESEVEMEQLQ